MGEREGGIHVFVVAACKKHLISKEINLEEHEYVNNLSVSPLNY